MFYFAFLNEIHFCGIEVEVPNAMELCGFHARRRFDLRLEPPMNLFLEILRATAYLASIVRSVLYVIERWKEYKQNG